MARTEVIATSIVRAGVTGAAAVVYADITNYHQIKNNLGNTFVRMVNVSNASSVDVTFDVVKKLDGDLDVYDLIVSVAPGGGEQYAGPFKTGVFNQATENALYFDVSSTGVSFEAYIMTAS